MVVHCLNMIIGTYGRSMIIKIMELLVSPIMILTLIMFSMLQTPEENGIIQKFLLGIKLKLPSILKFKIFNIL